MHRHLRTIRYVSLFRVVVELALGVWVTLVAIGWDSEGRWSYHPTARPEAGDREVFYIIGGGLVLLGLLRLAQVIGASRLQSWSRKIGQGLGVLDVLTPLTLPLGLWVLFVYQHPDTRHLFRKKGSPREPVEILPVS